MEVRWWSVFAYEGDVIVVWGESEMFWKAQKPRGPTPPLCDGDAVAEGM